MRWAGLILAVPVALLLAGPWEATALFAAVCAALTAPVLAWQWCGRRRQRTLHARGVPEWIGHLPLESVVGFWDVSVGAAFRFGAGVPVRLAGRPLGLLLEARRQAGAPVLIGWEDVVSVRCGPGIRMTDWGRVGVLPFAVVEIDLDGGGTLPFATLDASGLAELITRHAGDRPGTQRG